MGGIGEGAPTVQRKYIIKTAHGSMQAAIEAVDDDSGTIVLSPVRHIRVFEYPDKTSRCVPSKGSFFRGLVVATLFFNYIFFLAALRMHPCRHQKYNQYRFEGQLVCLPSAV
jgi:hypothetical protein